MAVDVGSAVGYLDLDVTGFLNGLRSAQSEADSASRNIATKVGGNLQSVGKSLTSAGTTLTKGLTLPLVAAGTAAFKFSSDFETAVAKVSTIADPAAKSIGDMKTEIVDLSNETGMAASDLAEATYQAISAGVDTASSVGFVSDASKLATAGFTDTTTAVDTLTTIINAYGLEAKDATHISDVLISTQNKGKTTVGELGASMGKVIPTANAMGVSIEDLGTAYAFMTSNGIGTAESTTYLNGMMNELGKSGTKVSDTLKKKTGKSFQELMNDGASLHDVLDVLQQSADESGVGFNDLWGSAEAGKAALTLLNSTTEEYNDTLKDFQTTSGDTESAFETMADTTQYKLGVALQNGKNALMELGETLKTMLLPFIEKGVALLQRLNEWLGTLSDEQKEQIVKIAAVVAAIGPLLVVFGKLTSGVGGLITTFGKIPGMITKLKSGFSLLSGAIGGISAPVVAVVAVIAVLVAAFKHLWDTNEEFRASITAIWEQIKGTFDKLCQGIVERLNKLGFDFENIGEVIKAIWEGFCNFLAPIFEGVFQNIANIFETAVNVILGIVDFFIAVFSGDWEGAWNAIKGIFESVWNGIVAFFQNIGNTLLGVLDAICGWFGTTWNDTWNSIKQFFVDIWTGIQTFFSDMATNISTGFSNFINGVVEFFSQLPYNIGRLIGEALGHVIKWVTDMVAKARELGTNFLNAVVEFFTQLPGKILQFITSAFENIKKWATDMPNKAREMGTNFINNVVKFFTQLPGKVKQFLDSTIENLKKWVTDMGNKGKEAVTSLINNVLNAAKDIPSKVMSIGRDIVEGVWNGIKNAASWFKDQVSGFFSGIVDGVKSVLGIGSPSKVFRDQIGKWLPAGVATGFKAAMPSAMKAMEKDLNKGIDNLGANDISIGAKAEAIGFGDTIKSIYDDLVAYFESIEARIGRSVQNMAMSLAMLIQQGQVLVNSDGTLGYVGYGGFASNPTSDKYTDRASKDKSKAGEGDTFVFNSPKPIDEIEAAKQMKKTKQDMAEGF